MERLHGQSFHAIRQAKDEALAWLLWYNQSRMHSTIDCFSRSSSNSSGNRQRRQSRKLTSATPKAGYEKQESKRAFSKFPTASTATRQTTYGDTHSKGKVSGVAFTTNPFDLYFRRSSRYLRIRMAVILSKNGIEAMAMVLSHFKLREQPFGVTPDPRYLYASATHREALASLLYGVESGLGFVTLTAKPGMGKTTLLFETLRRLQETTKTVFLFQTISTPIDLVRALLIDLGIDDRQGSLIEMQCKLNEVLIAQRATGKRFIIIIDEAQNLDDSVLEAVRMLSNFETPRRKLIQTILSGQPEFDQKLLSPHLLQLRQRISIFGRLEPLSATEAIAYVHHRLRVAGCDSPDRIFDRSALFMIGQYSGGTPRNINNICFNALSLGCALGYETIDSDVIAEVLADIGLKRGGARVPPLEPATKKGTPARNPRLSAWSVKPNTLLLLAVGGIILAIVLPAILSFLE